MIGDRSLHPSHDNRGWISPFTKVADCPINAERLERSVGIMQPRRITASMALPPGPIAASKPP